MQRWEESNSNIDNVLNDNNRKESNDANVAKKHDKHVNSESKETVVEDMYIKV